MTVPAVAALAAPEKAPVVSHHSRALTPELLRVRAKFALYYEQHAPAPSYVSQREFGAGFEKKIDFRHKAFSKPDDLQVFLKTEAPLFVSYSVARYEFPAARPVEKKHALAADLVFDLDNTYLNEAHPHGGLVCAYCLERSKQDAVRLCEDFLFNDFGFSKPETFLAFSGAKGFHIHVQGDAVSQLSREARRQLVEYVTAERLTVQSFMPERAAGERTTTFRGPARASKGWAGHVYRHAANVLGRSRDELVRWGFTLPAAKKIEAERAFVLGKLAQGKWDIPELKNYRDKLVQQSLDAQRVVVDKQVTLDEARLIRLEDSLHGDTGLVAKKLAWSDVEKFQPLQDAVAFRSPQPLAVLPLVDAAFEIQNQSFVVQANQEIELPESAAVLLLCKKKARIA